MMKLDSTLARYFCDCGNFEAEDFLHAYGDPRQALLAFRLFWPELTRVSGYVVLKTHVDSAEALNACVAKLERREKPTPEVLAGYRWIEVACLFSKNQLAEDDDRLLAEMMAETWLGALHQFEPALTWRTRVLHPDETGSVWGVAFYGG
jgi:hypothetical protein